MSMPSSGWRWPPAHRAPLQLVLDDDARPGQRAVVGLDELAGLADVHALRLGQPR